MATQAQLAAQGQKFDSKGDIVYGSSPASSPIAAGTYNIAGQTYDQSGQLIQDGWIIGGGSPYFNNRTGTTDTSRFQADIAANLQMPTGGAVTNAKDMGMGAVNIPQPPKPINYTGAILGGNTGLSPSGLLNPDGTIQIPQQEPSSDKPAEKEDAGNRTLLDTIKEQMGIYAKPESQADIYNNLERESKLEEKKQAVRNYTGQINAITAQAQADQLSVMGQGRGIPEVIIGGQQAQISKEAAIKVLPIQAQLSAAQGDLEQAQSHVDKLFQVYSADSMAKTEYYNKVVSASYDIFSKAEQRKLDDIRADKKAQQDALQRDIDYQRDLAQSALKNGQSALFSKISSVKPPVAGTKTYETDKAKYMDEISRLGGGLKDIGFLQAQANIEQSRASTAASYAQMAKIKAETKKMIDENAAKTSPAAKQLGLAQSQSNISLITGLAKDPAIRSAVGPTTIGRLIGRGLDSATGVRQNFVSGVEQLRSQLTLDSLINAKERGATFGALSEGELKTLNASASKLGTWAIKDKSGNVTGYRAAEKDFKKEMDKIANFAKLDYIIKGGSPLDIGAQVMPDGTVVVQNSDGTYTELN